MKLWNIQKTINIMASLQAIKQRFEIIGNSVGLNRAIEKKCKFPQKIFQF